jgi:hypothetical protein
MIFQAGSLCKPFFWFRGELLYQNSQLTKRVGIQPPRRQTERVVGRWIGPVRPCSWDAETAAGHLAKNQCVDAANLARLEHLEALTAKRMEWMTDLRPSQILVMFKCSSR